MELHFDNNGDDANIPFENQSVCPTKVCVCGVSGVGKSSLIVRLCDNSFTVDTVSTIGVDFKIKKMRASTGETIKLNIWDMAGQDRFHTVTTSYFRETNAILFVFDITNKTSFHSISMWMKLAGWEPTREGGTDYRGHKDYTLGFLVGCKSDLKELREVSDEEANDFAISKGLGYFDVSAKTSENVESFFQIVADQIASLNQEWVAAGKGSVYMGRQKNVVKLTSVKSRTSKTSRGCSC